MTSPDASEALEAFIDKVVRDQPSLHAPQQLATHVFAAIERREILLRRRWDFRSWVPSARIAFFAVSLSAIALALAAWSSLLGVLASSAPLSISRELALLQVVITVGASLAHSIPAHWFYAALAAVAALYVAFFGIGAAAYRVLYEQR